MKTYKQLIFDADDTLFDFQTAEKVALETTLTAFGLYFDADIYRQYKDISKRLWQELELGLVTQEILKYQRFEELAKMMDLSVDTRALAEAYLENLSQQGILLHDALEIVKALSAEYDLYILTNGITSVQKGRFQHSPIMAYVKGIVISEEAGVNKPDPQIFEFFNSKYGPFKKAELLVIGDSLTSDIQGGINYGIDTCWFNPKGAEAAPLVPTYQIQTLDALYALLL